ncbi:MAG: hypothetical protein FOGNACKC_04565 [Anaerolineae bacterium]|nr:hypothetical protein [Anaerolineae bacterium]
MATKLQTDVEAAVESLLQNLPPGVKVDVNFTPDGAITFTVQQTKEQILKEKYGHLLGKKLSLTEAAKKYNVPRGTLLSWVYYTNYLSPVDSDAYPKLFNEAEVAYLVDIYEERRRVGSKALLVDDDGLPYEFKHPNLAEYRRNKKN